MIINDPNGVGVEPVRTPHQVMLTTRGQGEANATTVCSLHMDGDVKLPKVDPAIAAAHGLQLDADGYLIVTRLP